MPFEVQGIRQGRLQPPIFYIDPDGRVLSSKYLDELFTALKELQKAKDTIKYCTAIKE